MFYEAHNIEVEINCVYIGASLDIQKGGGKKEHLQRCFKQLPVRLLHAPASMISALMLLC